MLSTRRKRFCALFTAALWILLASPTGAEVRIELEETEISAARELPKVLYIVPWQKTQPDSRPLPMRSLVDETLSPVEMDVFKRRVRYHNLTTQKP
ncbi:MAG: hypothetical protein L3J88_05880 [Gammaproteobacteria bacterium]|nr:hypothetical protein [Gammaproteobacteria bacterium]MCF6362864.1 hypothetical protein [Gammaproteobacteria bacterium]